jgi:hypothetical protein
MSSYSPERLAGLALSQYPKLKEGEASKTYRVRASVEVHEWLGSMTAEERGAMLEEVYRRYTGAVSEVVPVPSLPDWLTKAQTKAMLLVHEGARVQRGLKQNIKLIDKEGQAIRGVRSDTLQSLVDLKLLSVEGEENE